MKRYFHIFLICLIVSLPFGCAHKLDKEVSGNGLQGTDGSPLVLDVSDLGDNDL